MTLLFLKNKKSSLVLIVNLRFFKNTIILLHFVLFLYAMSVREVGSKNLYHQLLQYCVANPPSPSQISKFLHGPYRFGSNSLR